MNLQRNSPFSIKKKGSFKKTAFNRGPFKASQCSFGQAEKQLEKLKKQSEKAEQFKRLKEQIRAKDISMSLDLRHLLQRECHGVSDQLEDRQKQCLGYRRKIEKWDKGIQELSASYKEKQLALEAQQNEAKLIQEHSLSVQTTLAGLQASLQVNTDNKNQFHRDAQSLKKNRQTHLRLGEELTEKLKNLKHQSEKYKEHYRHLHQEYEKYHQQFLNSDVQRQSVESELLKLSQKEMAWQKMNQVLVESINEINLREEETDQQLRRIQKEISVLNEKQTQLSEQLDEAGQSCFSWSDSSRSLKQNIQFFAKEIQVQRESLQQIQTQLQALDLEKKNLQKIQSHRIIFQKEKENTQSQSLKDSFSYLTDKISMASSEWQWAFQMLLGPRIQAVFFEKASSALSVLSGLTDEDIQKGYHFILKEYQKSQIPPPQEKDAVGKEAGFLFFFTDQLEGDSDVIASLFSYTAAVESLSVALRLRRKYPEWCFITKVAEMVTKEGELIGGNNQINGQMTVLDYQRLMKEIPKQYHQLELQRDVMRKKLKRTEGLLEKASEELQELNNKQNHSQISVSSIKKDLELCKRDKEKLILEISNIEKDKLFLRQKRKQLKEKQFLLKKEFNSPQIHSLQQDLEKVKKECQEWEKEQESLSVEKEQISIKNLSVEKNIELLNEKKHILELSLKTDQEREQSLLSVSDEKKHLIQNYEGLIREQESQQKEYSKKWEVQNQRIEQFKRQCEEIHKKIDTYQSNLRMSHQQLSEMEGIVHELQMKKESLLLKRDSLQKRIYELYQVELSNIKDAEKENVSSEIRNTDSLEQQETELQSLKMRLDRMGAINLLALNEYDDLNQENRFYQKQYEDLTTSKEKLTEVIKRVDSFCSRKFMEAFEKVNGYFSKVFSALFEGGEAGLVLTKEEKGEEGMDVMVQPPGKNIQNMNLLSGGEKAMTAVALIFSLFLIKPSPFCILDEVDAALDDVNINRFNSLLKEMSSVSQVLIVTHNKLTMKIADNIFGVTMQKQGVSQVLSLDMVSLGPGHLAKN